MNWFLRLYDRRIVNVNVNIVLAGACALGITVGVMALAESWGLIDWLSRHVPDLKAYAFGRGFEFSGRAIVITSMTFLVDVVADVAVYYLLHWVANHMPRSVPRIKHRAYASLSYMRDATLVQFERALLSPLLYIVALGLQHWMLNHGSSIAKATTYGFAAGILAARLLHTLWMLRAERRAEQAAAMARKDHLPPSDRPAEAVASSSR